MVRGLGELGELGAEELGKIGELGLGLVDRVRG